jgi:hypothetical protein
MSPYIDLVVYIPFFSNFQTTLSWKSFAKVRWNSNPQSSSSQQSWTVQLGLLQTEKRFWYGSFRGMPLLSSKNFPKKYYSSRHIESLDTCMEH